MIDIKFGPVNTYKCKATFYARKGGIEPYEMGCNDYSSSFHWEPNYHIERFRDQWTLEKFKEGEVAE